MTCLNYLWANDNENYVVHKVVVNYYVHNIQDVSELYMGDIMLKPMYICRHPININELIIHSDLYINNGSCYIINENNKRSALLDKLNNYECGEIIHYYNCSNDISFEHYRYCINSGINIVNYTKNSYTLKITKNMYDIINVTRYILELICINFKYDLQYDAIIFNKNDYIEKEIENLFLGENIDNLLDKLNI